MILFEGFYVFVNVFYNQNVQIFYICSKWFINNCFFKVSCYFCYTLYISSPLDATTALNYIWHIVITNVYIIDYILENLYNKLPLEFQYENDVEQIQELVIVENQIKDENVLNNKEIDFVLNSYSYYQNHTY